MRSEHDTGLGPSTTPFGRRPPQGSSKGAQASGQGPRVTALAVLALGSWPFERLGLLDDRALVALPDIERRPVRALPLLIVGAPEVASPRAEQSITRVEKQRCRTAPE